MGKRHILLAAGLAAFAGVLALNYHLKKRPDPKEYEHFTTMMTVNRDWSGRYAPDFAAVTLSGDTVVISDLVGRKVIVLNFFATWCRSCVDEMPELIAYFEKHRNEDFLLVGIDASEDRATVLDFVLEQKVSFPVVIDEHMITARYRAYSYPTTVVIGLDGKVQLYEVGGIPNADVTFDPILRRNEEIRARGGVITRDSYLAEVRRAGPFGFLGRDTASSGSEADDD